MLWAIFLMLNIFDLVAAAGVMAHKVLEILHVTIQICI
jgi:hypothetical protein